MTEDEVKQKPVFILVPKRLLAAWITTTIVLFVGVLVSFQYANYVDRKSNQRWCGIVLLFNKAYKTTPPPTDIGKQIAARMAIIQKEFGCK
jgi:hypothetical protein